MGVRLNSMALSLVLSLHLSLACDLLVLTDTRAGTPYHGAFYSRQHELTNGRPSFAFTSGSPLLNGTCLFFMRVETWVSMWSIGGVLGDIDARLGVYAESDALSPVNLSNWLTVASQEPLTFTVHCADGGTMIVSPTPPAAPPPAAAQCPYLEFTDAADPPSLFHGLIFALSPSLQHYELSSTLSWGPQRDVMLREKRYLCTPRPLYFIFSFISLTFLCCARA